VARLSSGAQPTKAKPLAVISVYGRGLLLVVEVLLVLVEVVLVVLEVDLLLVDDDEDDDEEDDDEGDCETVFFV
jgi:hypothetical protein